jgi:hypothetical protein
LKQAVRSVVAAVAEEEVLGLLISKPAEFIETKVQQDADRQAADIEVEEKEPDVVEVSNDASKKKKPTGA